MSSDHSLVRAWSCKMLCDLPYPLTSRLVQHASSLTIPPWGWWLEKELAQWHAGELLSCGETELDSPSTSSGPWGWQERQHLLPSCCWPSPYISASWTMWCQCTLCLSVREHGVSLVCMVVFPGTGSPFLVCRRTTWRVVPMQILQPRPQNPFSGTQLGTCFVTSFMGDINKSILWPTL